MKVSRMPKSCSQKRRSKIDHSADHTWNDVFIEESYDISNNASPDISCLNDQPSVLVESLVISELGEVSIVEEIAVHLIAAEAKKDDLKPGLVSQTCPSPGDPIGGLHEPLLAVQQADLSHGSVQVNASETAVLGSRRPVTGSEVSCQIGVICTDAVDSDADSWNSDLFECCESDPESSDGEEDHATWQERLVALEDAGRPFNLSEQAQKFLKIDEDDELDLGMMYSSGLVDSSEDELEEADSDEEETDEFEDEGPLPDHDCLCAFGAKGNGLLCSSPRCVNCPPAQGAKTLPGSAASLVSEDEGQPREAPVKEEKLDESDRKIGSARKLTRVGDDSWPMPLGVVNKRLRARNRKKRATNIHRILSDPIEGCSQSLMKAAEWISLEDGTRPTTLPKSEDIRMSRKISDFSKEDCAIARGHYERFHEFPEGTSTTAMVVNTSAGIEGWRDFDPDLLMKVGKDVASPIICGFWLKQALSAMSDVPEWERIVLTVDSGAAETVVPPHVAKNLPLLHSNRVGTVYEVANGGEVINLGEKQAEVVTKMGNANSMLMNFQVVKVHKPLLAVSRLVEAGHKVFFDKEDCHIKLASGEKVPMRCTGGTYEVELWIKNPGFARPTGR